MLSRNIYGLFCLGWDLEPSLYHDLAIICSAWSKSSGKWCLIGSGWGELDRAPPSPILFAIATKPLPCSSGPLLTLLEWQEEGKKNISLFMLIRCYYILGMLTHWFHHTYYWLWEMFESDHKLDKVASPSPRSTAPIVFNWNPLSCRLSGNLNIWVLHYQLGHRSSYSCYK